MAVTKVTVTGDGESMKSAWDKVNDFIDDYEAATNLGDHKNSHDPADGADPLDTAAPSELASVQAAGVGSSHSLARADHQHQIQHSIADNHLVTIDDADAADNDYAKFTANGLEGRSKAEVLSDINVEDGANVTDAANVGSSIHGAANKATPINADKVPLIDTAGGNTLKTSTWTNIKAFLKTYFDTLYGDVTTAANITDNRVATGDGGAKGVQESPASISDAGTLSGINQIAFPATAVPSADPNTLDDYEEGTWTPTLVADVDFTSVTYDGYTGGRYRKIGDLVHIQAELRTDEVIIGSAADQVSIGGFPFNCKSNSGSTLDGRATFSVDRVANWGGDMPIACQINVGTSAPLTYRSAVNGASIDIAVTDVGTGANANCIHISGGYITQ